MAAVSEVAYAAWSGPATAITRWTSIRLGSRSAAYVRQRTESIGVEAHK